MSSETTSTLVNLYRCPDTECAWTGHEDDMGADFTDGEAWSNWICPKCGQWYWLANYEHIGTMFFAPKPETPEIVDPIHKKLVHRPLLKWIDNRGRAYQTYKPTGENSIYREDS